jgi:S-disulfanyl-L-cysteine oxidoreductase SoxD
VSTLCAADGRALDGNQPMNMKRRKVLVVSVASGLAVVLALAMLYTATRGKPVRLLADDADAMALGAKVYTTQCASCHGAKLEGQANWRARGADGVLPAPPHDASGHTWHHPDDVLFRITKYGVAKAANIPDYRSAMPAFEGVLTDAEIIAVLSWIKAQWPAGIRSQQELINTEYMKKQRG